MACTNCTNTKVAADCGTNLTIGGAPSASTAYAVYFQDQATGRTRMIAVTSGIGATNLLTLTLTNAGIVHGHTYEIWITASGSTMNNRLNITIGALTVTCLYAKFEKIFDTSNTDRK